MKKKNGTKSKGLTRREFLVSSGLITAGLSASSLAGVLKAPYARAAGKPPILIGNLEPRSGPYADSGRDEYQGYLMATEEWNAKGGVLGRKVKLITEDTATNPGIGVQKALKLINRSKVNFLTGTVSSAVTLAISALALRNKILFMASGSHSDATTGKDAHRCTFRTTCSNFMLASSVATYLARDLGVRTVCQITADYTWGHSARNSMNFIFKRYGTKELNNDMTPLGTTDFSSQLIKAKGLKPDCLILNLYGADQINAVKQFREFRLNKVMKLAGPLSGVPMAKGFGDAADGIWGLVWEAKVDTPGSKDLVARFTKRWKSYPTWAPTFRTYLGWLTQDQLLQAIQRAGTTDVIPVVKALEGWKFDGLKWNPNQWRIWDHQDIQDVLVCKCQKGPDWKTEADYFKILSHNPGWAAAKSYSLWKKLGGHKLEPYSYLK